METSDFKWYWYQEMMYENFFRLSGKFFVRAQNIRRIIDEIAQRNSDLNVRELGANVYHIAE